jgi:hypothetical protein
MTRSKWHVLIVVALVVVVEAPLVRSASAHNFVSNFGCAASGGSGWKSYWSRSNALNYAMIADREGYQWGGGCWNTDNVDNQRGDPTQTASTHGEGPDCSGFVYKTWALSPNASGGFLAWSIYYYGPHSENGLKAHGPFTAYSYKTGNNSAWGPVSKSNAKMMDAFASSSHIGMIRQANTAYNTDLIIQAKSESVGTLVRSETYRGSSSYSGVRRKNWST